MSEEQGTTMSDEPILSVRNLIKRFGGLTGDVLDPGLNWRTPFIDKVVIVPTVIQSYETSDNPNLSSADYTDIAVAAQTIDGQQITVKYTVLFAIPSEQAVTIVQNIGTVDRVVENVVKASSRSWARVLAQNYSAEDLYSGEGILEYQHAVEEALAGAFEANGFSLDEFLIRKIDFDQQYIDAIEQQQIAHSQDLLSNQFKNGQTKHIQSRREMHFH